MSTSLQNYFDMLSNSTEFETYQGPNEVEMYTINVTGNNYTLASRKITQDQGGNINLPFADMDDHQIHQYVDNMREIQIRYSNITVDMPEDRNRDVTCFIWNINQRYYHTESAQVRIELETILDDCNNST